MMVRIDHSNYEAWLLDRLEGRLSPEQQRLLDAFLLAHSDLMPEEESLPAIDPDSATLADADRAALKRSLPPVGKVTEQTLHDHLIALHEGDLSPAQQQALEDFMRAHPEARRDERLFANARIGTEEMPHPDREGLRRSLPPTGLPTLADLDDFLVAKLEGDLDAHQEQALAQVLSQNEPAQKAWALISATRTAPEAIVFAGKAELKRSGKVIAIGFAAWTRRLSAAASIALLLGLGWWWLRGGPVSTPEVVQRDAPAQLPIVNESNAKVQAPLAEGSAPSIQEVKPVDTAAAAVNTPNERVGAPHQPVHHQPVPQQEPVPQEGPLAEEPYSPKEQPFVIEPAVQAEEPQTVAHSALAESRENTVAVPSLGQAITGVVRERMLAMDAEPERSLDATDAEAAANRALQAVAGHRAGFALQRDAKGRSKGFDLRLGRHVALSARR